MSIALSEEHRELARVARAFLASHDARRPDVSGSPRVLGEVIQRHPSQLLGLGFERRHLDLSFSSTRRRGLTTQDVP